MQTGAIARRESIRRIEGSTDQVVAHAQLDRACMPTGDRLSELTAVRVGVSRPTVRAGLHALAAMGSSPPDTVGHLHSRGPLALGSEPLSFRRPMDSRATRWTARRVPGQRRRMAAERATPEQLASWPKKSGLFAVIDDPQQFLVHDIDFHRDVAGASQRFCDADRNGLSALLRVRRKTA
jgi:GntR family transcriptional repressor for pyruvate dehydrogenase complex